MDFSQASRNIKLNTPLGSDQLAIESFHCREAISELFKMQLSVLSKDDSIEPKALIGLNVTVELILDDGSSRYFNGYVSSLTGGHKSSRDLRQYQMVVVPWLWFLTQNQDCRIFQNKTIVEIIEEVFNDRGFSDFKTGGMLLNHPVREYCVQYRETDFDFISRLMEEEGIFYYFEHEDGKHTLVLTDDKSSYTPCDESEIPVNPGTSGLKASIKQWEHQYQFCTGKWSYNDYNFEMPTNKLATDTPTIIDLPNIKNFEIYDYPGEYSSRSDGTPLTKVRMEALEATYDRVDATSECKTLFAGGTFTVKHDIPSENDKEYVVTAIEHSISQASYDHGGGGFTYLNHFVCVPSSVNCRPVQKTPRPQIHGTQTAVVVGPSGEEIHVDKFSRIKVQFHWDRKGKYNESSSCWIRVAQGWAGKQWGQIFIPRIGQEVVVSFLEGDPDRPLVIGSVYNGDMMPPYELPANKTQSGILTRSSKGGSPSTFNQIRFEDKKGEEELYIHAEKDENIYVENNQTTYVGNDQTIQVDNDRNESIKRDRTLLVERHKKETVSATKTMKPSAAT